MCRDFQLTELSPGNGEWIDTGIVPVLLPKEENKRKWGELIRDMEQALLRCQPKRAERDIEEEKRKIMELEREREYEEVPF